MPRVDVQRPEELRVVATVPAERARERALRLRTSFWRRPFARPLFINDRASSRCTFRCLKAKDTTS